MIAFLKRLFCRHRGGISFHRNIYGDEINVANARSVWKCKRCGGYVYMPNLGGPDHDQS